MDQPLTAGAKTSRTSSSPPKRKPNAQPVDENSDDDKSSKQPQWDDEDANKPDPPEGSTAECVDGTYSKAKLRKDACKDHRGVMVWLADVRPKYK